MKKIIIVGGGFAGLNAAIKLGNKRDVQVTLIDRRNHHIFQPLLYQVAMADLGPSEIAAPIRSILRKFSNILVLKGEVQTIDSERQIVACKGTRQELEYDYLILASGAKHHYFGNEHWEEYAPGLKTMPQAIELRRRVLEAFEEAEREPDKALQKRLLTIVVVGGGATGVEVAGALGEMSRHTLAKDFRRIDPKKARIVLLEGSDRLLAGFDPKLSDFAARALERKGVQVWTNSIVTEIDDTGVTLGDEHIKAATVIWAAGVKASEISEAIDHERDRMGRLMVEEDLSLKNQPNVFAVGDIAHYAHTKESQPLPGLAPVAVQQGVRAAKNILADLSGKPRNRFSYTDKGTMATIGKNNAIADIHGFRMSGYFAWLTWLFVHIYYLIGFRNRIVVMLNWMWGYFTSRRGSRLIINKEWRFYADKSEKNT